MPVRRLFEVEFGELGMVELGDEHGGHAVERGAALLGDGLQGGQGIEGFGGIDHGRAMGQAAEIAHHHAEAVIERHGNAQPVVGREPEPAGHEVAVVQDVVVAERGALGVPGGARGELDVDGVVELQLRADLGQPHPLGVAAGLGDVVEIEHARRLLGSQAHDVLEMGQLARLHQVGGDLEVVRGLERRRQHQRLALDLVHRVFELGAAVGRVDVDQHQPRLGGGELGQGPFRAVGRPHADAVAGLQPERQQAGREIVDAAAELAPAPAHVLLAHHQRLAVAPGLDRAVEEGADGLAQELLVGNAVIVRNRGDLGHGPTLAAGLPRLNYRFRSEAADDGKWIDQAEGFFLRSDPASAASLPTSCCWRCSRRGPTDCSDSPGSSGSRVQTESIKARMPRRQRGTGLRSSSERVCRSALRCA